MRINTNINAMRSIKQIVKGSSLAEKAMRKLSTGLRITKAADDASGLAVSEKMRAQIRGMEQAYRNVQDGISMVQTISGSLEEAENIAQRISCLAVQAANGTLATEDRKKIKNELEILQEELQKIGEESKFNGNELIHGTETLFTIQSGANGETREVSMDYPQFTFTLVLPISIDVSDSIKAQEFLYESEWLLMCISEDRANLAVTQNRLEYVCSNLTTSTENLLDTESRIRDVDVAKEIVKLSKLNVLNQVSQAMVGQARQQPKSVIQLLI